MQLECFQALGDSPGSDFFRSLFVGAATLGCVSPTFPDLSFTEPPGIHILIDDFSNVDSLADTQEASWEAVSDGSLFAVVDAPEKDLRPVAAHLESLVDNLVIPHSWRIEGFDAPTASCLIFSKSILRRLFDNYGFLPYKIAASKEGGVFAAYRTPSGKITLRVEVDNELDVVAVVSDGHQILDSGFLEADDIERSIIDSFTRALA
jgi:hypothetical protein